MGKLNSKQEEEYKILVRLGDSHELALKTVLNDIRISESFDNSFHYNAYCI